jgi:glycosyltransferase involved in cell wall biosynthesis
MRIGIDAHALGTGIGGNETFIRQLLRALRIVAPETDVLAIVHAELHGQPGAAEGFPTCPLPTRSAWLRVPFVLPWLAWREKLDLLQVQYTAPPYCPCPYIVALHDIVWKHSPETLPVIDRYRLAAFAPRTLRRACRVFCLTEAIKQEAHEIYGVPLDKVDVVSPAVDAIYHPIRDEAVLSAVREKYRLPADFVLYVGALQPRKNLVHLAAAFARLKDRGLPHRLAFTGKRTFYGPIAEDIDRLDLGDRLIFTDYVETDDLPRLMCAASAFAYISLYEGFGIPVAEALACGTPVLTSTAPALVEISGGAALTCDPFDVDAIEDALVRLLTDSELRDRCRRAGPERARHYSLENMGRAAVEGYRKALETER